MLVVLAADREVTVRMTVIVGKCAVEASPALIREAQTWIQDLVFWDLTSAEVRRLSVEQVVAGVERHYEGGWAQFVRDGS